MVPVIGDRVGAKFDEYTSRKLAFDDVRASQSRDAKKRRNLIGIAQRSLDIENAFINFPLNQ